MNELDYVVVCCCVLQWSVIMKGIRLRGCMLLCVTVERHNEGIRLRGCMLLCVIVERDNEGIRLRGCMLLYVTVEHHNEGN